jgi:hypothetical protein
MNKRVVIVSAVRTPIGSFRRIICTRSRLGCTAIHRCSKLDPTQLMKFGMAQLAWWYVLHVKAHLRSPTAVNNKIKYVHPVWNLLPAIQTARQIARTTPMNLPETTYMVSHNGAFVDLCAPREQDTNRCSKSKMVNDTSQPRSHGRWFQRQ